MDEGVIPFYFESKGLMAKPLPRPGRIARSRNGHGQETGLTEHFSSTTNLAEP